METEKTVQNGSHDPELETEEKILKPRKSLLSDDIASNMHNGNNENGTTGAEENGHEAEIIMKENNTKKNQIIEETKKQSTPKKQSNKRINKDATPPKRELRPRESTPKHEFKSLGTPGKVTEDSPKNIIETKKNIDEPKIIESEIVNDSKYNDGENVNKLQESIITLDDTQKSAITIEDTDIDEESIVQIHPSSELLYPKEPEGIFSALRQSFKNKSLMSPKDKREATSSQSIVCKDSSSMVEGKYTPRSNDDIKGRKPIHSFSRFPGRNVSYEIIDSRKRRADESPKDDVERKRFAGETESGSEKSPGWNFFSPGFGRVWSPARRNKSFVSTSTPLQDSMAVNYDEETKLSLNETEEAQASKSIKINTPETSHKWCNVM